MTTSNAIAAGCAACALLLTVTAQVQAQEAVIRAGTLLDGQGRVSRSVNVIVEGSKIKSVGSPSGARLSYDLSRLTVLPGLIDTHVHIATHFGTNGRATSEGEAPEESILYEAENAYAMLLNGFTTAQSIGARLDLPLRAAIARGVLPGPRSEEHTSELQSLRHLVCRLLLEKSKLAKVFYVDRRQTAMDRCALMW